MIKLKVTNEDLDLGSDLTITLDEESPVFDTHTIPGGYSFPFSLPVTPRNRRILGFPERIEKAAGMTVEKPFQLFHTGKLRASGSMNVSEAGDEYRVYLAVGTGDLASTIKDKKLKDLNLGGTRTWEWKTEYRYPEDDFALFPIYNEKFGEYTPYPAYANNLYRLNAFENGAFYQDVGENFVVCPFPFIAYLVAQIFHEHGFQIIESILHTDPDLRDLVLYHNFDITVQQMTVGGGIRVLDQWNMQNLMPDILISDFLISLRNLFNLAFVVESGNRVRIISRQSMVKRPLDRDITQRVAGRGLVTNIKPPDGIKLSWEHDPTDSLFEEGFKNIEDYLRFLKDPVANTGVLDTLEPTLNEIRYVISLDKYYRYIKAEDVPYAYSWQEFSIGFQNYLLGNFKEEFSSKFSTLLMVNFQRLVGGPFVYCPYTQQQGWCLDEAEEITPFSPRLLFYRGLQNDSLDNPVPSGSSDNLNHAGQIIAGKKLCLRWEGDYGLYAQLWKDYLLWWMSRKQITWTIKDPSSLKFNEKYSIDGKHYLLKKRTINLGVNSIEPGECEFYLI